MKKKLIVIPAIALGLGLATFGVCSNKMMVVRAEEETTEEVIPEEVEEMTEEEKLMLDEVKGYLAKYISNESIINLIITALTQAGLMIGLLAILIKFKKYKAMSSKEIANKVEDAIKDVLVACFKEMSAKQLTKVIDGINKGNEMNEAVIKALVLAQDKSVEGKLALLDLLKSKTENVETVELIEDTKEELVEEKERKEEITEKVSGEYKNIF